MTKDVDALEETAASGQIETRVGIPAGPTGGSERKLAEGSEPPGTVLSVSELSRGQSGSGLRRGDTLDRFVILDQLGAGGMGVVLAAYDPDLDRKVAIKLLHPQFAGTSESARARLLREAQAMAKLSHPNVIAVHEVGTVNERIFIAMEFVDGGTLRAPADDPRTWRGILDQYVQAGRGLAAAHRAGLVHRDFKPDNVLVGRDGRVQVTDFGLVDIRGGASIAADVPATTSDRTHGLDNLTATGSVMGTPAYMAPEQHLGSDVDARADQFAFCVALYEALYRIRPFIGNTYEELVKNVHAGTIVPAPRSDVPAWLRRVLLRGMMTRPEDRYSSMDELLRELAYEERQRTRRSRIVAGGFAMTLGVAVAVVWVLRREPAPAAVNPCEGADGLASEAWNDGLRTAMRGAFERTKLPFASEAFSRSSQRLDAYTRSWAEQRTEACKATRVRGEQSESLMDLRMFCLDGQMSQVRALTELLAKADAKLVAQSQELIGGLPELTDCADRANLSLNYPPPAEPNRRARAKQLQDPIARIGVLINAGRYTDAKAEIPGVVADARALDHPPLLATILFHSASLQRIIGAFDAAKAEYQQAALAAARARDDTRLANSIGSIYYILGAMQNRAAEAAAMRPYVDLVFARAGDRSDSKSLLLEITGQRARNEGKFDEALAAYRETLKLNEHVTDASGPPKRYGAQLNIGLTLRDQGKLDEALAALVAVEKIAVENYGANNPVAGKVASAIGATMLMKGDIDGASKRLSSALAIQEASLGVTHTDCAETQTILGVVEQRRGQLERATEMFERARAGYLAAHGPDHPNVAFPIANLGNVHHDAGDFARALEYYLEAKRIWSPAFGAKHPHIAQLTGSIGVCRLGLGELDAAIRDFDAAIEVLRVGQTSVYAMMLGNRAITFAAQGRHTRARTDITEALALITKLQGDKTIEALQLRFKLGRILVLAGDRRGGRAEFDRMLDPARAAGNDLLTAELEHEMAKLLAADKGNQADRIRARDLAKAADARYAKMGKRSLKSRQAIATLLGAL